MPSLRTWRCRLNSGRKQSKLTEIAERQVHLKRAGEDFHTSVDDQRETQKLLQTGLDIRQVFYGKKALAFVQKQEPARSLRHQFEASGDVMGMIRETINDAKAWGRTGSLRRVRD